MTIRIGGGELKELKPRILVLGVGGAGGNAINAMIVYFSVRAVLGMGLLINE